jgi:hypothetical protein
VRLLHGIRVVALCVMSAAPVAAHEFWLDASTFRPKPGASAAIIFRIGEGMDAPTYPYVRALDRRFTLSDTRGIRRISTPDGEDPAAEITFRHPGLAVVVHERAPEPTTFDTFAAFEAYLRDDGLEAVATEHRRQRKADVGIRELFARCAKALIGVGTARGHDRPVGMPLEFVAETNPYRAAPGQVMTVRLLYRGVPLEGALVRVWHRDAPTSPIQMRTPADGRIAVSLDRPGEYLVGAVHMVEPVSGQAADWVSYWATLSFERPPR